MQRLVDMRPDSGRAGKLRCTVDYASSVKFLEQESTATLQVKNASAKGFSQVPSFVAPLCGWLTQRGDLRHAKSTVKAVKDPGIISQEVNLIDKKGVVVQCVPMEQWHRT